MATMPRYDEKSLGEVCDKAFKQIAAVPVSTEYTFSQEALETFDKLFKENASEHLPEPFFPTRNVSGLQICSSLHLILEKQSDEIDAADMAWAVRLCMHHIADAQKLLQFTSFEFIRLFEKSMIVFERCKQQGKPLYPW
ncbi:hypothetical protein BPMI_02570 [Candidatus Burkholderia pumila]|uniref:Uncharacterized protein n=1 Tax=Candidatus Burkholderia pumila TaxID=1090375 RepID=A0ABR5HN19_9BURK|nr:hypothetical protein BPMI_02570 [Candidatus Burkholderia pumila]